MKFPIKPHQEKGRFRIIAYSVKLKRKKIKKLIKKTRKLKQIKSNMRSQNSTVNQYVWLQSASTKAE